MTEGMDAPGQKHIPSAEELSRFRTYCVGSGKYAMSTTSRMIRRVRQLANVFDLDTVDEQRIWAYVEQQVRSGKKEKSVNNEMIDLGAWLSFKGRKILLPKLKQRGSPEPYVPTDDVIIRLIKNQDKKGNRSIGARNRAIIEVLAFGGLRLGELVTLNLEDFKDSGLHVRSEKGEAERFVGLPGFVVADVRGYIDFHRVMTSNALFTAPKAPGGRMPYNYVRKIIKEEGRKAGAPELHPHSLRHYCGTALSDGDINLRKVQIHLGHKSIRSTEIYANLRQTKVAGEVASFFDKHFKKEDRKMTELEPKNVNADGGEPISSGGCGMIPPTIGFIPVGISPTGVWDIEF